MIRMHGGSIKTTIKNQFCVKPFLVFFLIHTMQFGIGVLSFQRTLSESSGHDSWMAVIISGIIVHILISMIYKILDKEKGDLIVIHQQTFGKWAGGLLSIGFLLFFLADSAIVLRTYNEVIQVWMFPLMKTWPFALVFLLGVYYVVSNGFRTVTGVCFLGVVLPFYLFFTFFVPLEFSQFRNLLPVWDTSVKNVTLSALDSMFGFSGFQLLFLYYPFIQKPETSQKWAHYGNLFSMAIYLFILIVTLVYFKQDHLLKTTWPTLTLWKIIELPFVERFEFIGITSWSLIILPIICLEVWGASRIAKQLFKMNQKRAVAIFLLVGLMICSLLKDRESILFATRILSFAVYAFYIYIPFLFIVYHIRLRLRDRT
ncbi:spore germination protein (amino acid permease) [Bacillus sp. OV166]|uniref:GerAB/ArcD/ProY family transporter n=1 Tax=Bacillus sp. OV166 TaxID=1882763 RepID=UPI000A2AB0FB|nr:GerAB/ArcD/ProY family transporter [Bacillus sp. OV166]SMQ64313.1 spore germination protein (amino acid permease) [Bacillus sp. OV166]